MSGLFDSEETEGFIVEDSGMVYPVLMSAWKVCHCCRIPITEENNSRWAEFTKSKGIMEFLCNECAVERDYPM